MSRRILVTGGRGYLGEVVIPRLLEHPLVQRVIALDGVAPPLRPHAKLRAVAADIRDGYLLRSLMEEEAVDAVVHLAFRNANPAQAVLAKETNVHGTLVVLEAADKCVLVQKLVIASSTSAYGARRLGRPLTESDPLRAGGLPYAFHKRLMEEELGRSLPQVRRSLQVCVLRLAAVVGPGERPDGPVRRLRRLPFGLRAWCRRGGLQLLSEEDAAAAFCRAIEARDCRGAFNVAPDDALTVAEVCGCLGKPCLPLPLWLIWSALFLGRKLFATTVPEGVAPYLAHPLVASNAKIKAALGFSCAHSSRQALRQCLANLPETAAQASTTPAA
ncbi:MAG: NAD-dependent epimerase/dehydratase family protein [Elusimicrobia bacterium]|nr:NAD-dependent epimerase/dehydratase family protein [Elusimicrobiota bacterium]